MAAVIVFGRIGVIQNLSLVREREGVVYPVTHHVCDLFKTHVHARQGTRQV